MGDTSGIGGAQPPEPSSGPKGVEGGPSGEDIEKALHAKVRTLGQLKGVLVKYLGEKDGKKLYNQFIQSFAMEMLSQIQHSAQQAKKAAQQMRMNSQG